MSFNAPALAQDEPAAPPTPASDDSAAKPADAPAGTPAEKSAVEPEKAATDAAPPAPQAPPTETTATGTSVEREKLVSILGLELLPGSAYPAVQTRGIKYGSLWLTFHGQQWPYMPMVNGKPGLRIGFSGSLWNDVSYARINAESRGDNDQNRWATQTRGVVRVTPTYNANGGWFAQGNAELVLHGDQNADPLTKVLSTTDDLYVRVGKWNVFDVTVGRFQGWEIANHYGMGLDQNTLERQGAWIVTGQAARPTDGYGLSYFWDRQDNVLGAYAVHVYPTKYLRGEILGHLGAGNATSTPYQMDIRPSAIFDIGWLKLKAGLEYGKAKTQDVKSLQNVRKNGYGFAAQFVLNPWVEFGGSYARGFNDVIDNKGQPDLAGSDTVSTYGGFLNASPGYEPLVFGFGAFNNTREDMRPDGAAGPHFGKVDTNDQLQIFGAVQYTLWSQLYFKFVLSHANNHVEDFNKGIYTNTSLSGRFRMMLLF
ncbi:MAG: hypothetical protein WDO74_25445 [Pseudomonadota bacterium]